MAFLDDDPRSSLSTAPAADLTASDSAVRSTRYFDPDDLHDTVVRMQTCCFAINDVDASSVLSVETVDEYAVLLFESSPSVRIRAGEDEVTVDERALVIVPPGASTVEALGTGQLARVFTTRNADIVAQAQNAEDYAGPYPRCLPLPSLDDAAPSAGLRVYKLSDYPIRDGVFGRIFQTNDLMINFLADDEGPRDPAKLSPHHHDDFEQMSVTTSGEFVHHIRYPWTPDSTEWREDEHHEVSSPSIVLIPPPAIHTTQGLTSHHHLIDIFSPPRTDFGAQPGWVRNADEYAAR